MPKLRSGCAALFLGGLAACGPPPSETPSEPPVITGAYAPGGEEVISEAGCDTPGGAETGATLSLELQHDGQTRSYLLYVPDGAADEPLPLVLNWHAFNSSASEQAQRSAITALADQHGFAVALPQGIRDSFNAGTCCAELAEPPNYADDLGFARAVVADVSQRVCVDSSRVYSVGFSNGGNMSEYNACHSSDLFAAVASVSGLQRVQPSCDPGRSVPFMAINGTADTVVSYAASEESVAAWVERNGCQGEPERMQLADNVYCDRWSACDGGAEVERCTVEGMGHCWPGFDECNHTPEPDFMASEHVWEFFARFAL